MIRGAGLCCLDCVVNVVSVVSAVRNEGKESGSEEKRKKSSSDGRGGERSAGEIKGEENW